MNLLRWWRAHPEHRPSVLLLGAAVAINAALLLLMLAAKPHELKIPYGF